MVPMVSILEMFHINESITSASVGPTRACVDGVVQSVEGPRGSPSQASIEPH